MSNHVSAGFKVTCGVLLSIFLVLAIGVMIWMCFGFGCLGLAVVGEAAREAGEADRAAEQEKRGKGLTTASGGKGWTLEDLALYLKHHGYPKLKTVQKSTTMSGDGRRIEDFWLTDELFEPGIEKGPLASTWARVHWHDGKFDASEFNVEHENNRRTWAWGPFHFEGHESAIRRIQDALVDSRVAQKKNPPINEANGRKGEVAREISGRWVGVDSKKNQQVISLKADGSFSAGAVRNGEYRFTIFGRYQYVGSRLILSFQDGDSERGTIEWKDANTFSYKVEESTRNKSAVGLTIGYTRAD